MQLLHFTVVAGVAVPLYFPHFAVTILSMGNEQSSQGSSRQAGKDILKQVDIDHPILTTSGWAFYHAQSLPPHEPSLSLSLFISQNNAEDLEGIGKVVWQQSTIFSAGCELMFLMTKGQKKIT